MNVIEITNDSASTKTAEILITQFIENEYQLEILAGDKRALVSFYKGSHYIWHTGDIEVMEMYDSGHGMANKHSFRGAVLQELWELTDINDSFRGREATAIFKYLNLALDFAQHDSYKIIIHKEGRNGLVDNGQIILHRD
jgi:hypothetical protein